MQLTRVAFEDTPLPCELFILSVIHAPHLNEPVLRCSKEMIVIKLENISDRSLMSLNVVDLLSFHIKIPNFAIGLPKQNLI